MLLASASMPWHCPACQTLIAHRTSETLPIPNVVYRCHVCRLELRTNTSTGRLEVVPLSAADADRGRERPTS